jgi:hypothetical protein
MTLTDPFSAAPADEAQSVSEPTPEPVAVVTPAPAPKPVAAKPRPATTPPSEGKITTTFKGGAGFDSPWVVIHSNDLDDALDQVSGDNASKLALLMERVHKAGKHFTSLQPAAAPGAVAAPAPRSAPPQGASSAPGGETRQCKHGQMTYKTGFSAKTNKTWQAFMCPSPKGTPDQCEAEWIR